VSGKVPNSSDFAKLSWSFVLMLLRYGNVIAAFDYPLGSHTVFLVSTEVAFNNCDLTGAVQVPDGFPTTVRNCLKPHCVLLVVLYGPKLMWLFRLRIFHSLRLERKHAKKFVTPTLMGGPVS